MLWFDCTLKITLNAQHTHIKKVLITIYDALVIEILQEGENDLHENERFLSISSSVGIVSFRSCRAWV